MPAFLINTLFYEDFLLQLLPYNCFLLKPPWFPNCKDIKLQAFYGCENIQTIIDNIDFWYELFDLYIKYSIK